jgi:hypothetical protein
MGRGTDHHRELVDEPERVRARQPQAEDAAALHFSRRVGEQRLHADRESERLGKGSLVTGFRRGGRPLVPAHCIIRCHSHLGEQRGSKAHSTRIAVLGGDREPVYDGLVASCASAGGATVEVSLSRPSAGSV